MSDTGHDTSGQKQPPQHIAIIMDGNGRWAKERGLNRIEGHRRGAEVVRETVAACIDLNIRYLTLYSFSSENWSRPAQEVGALMALLKRFVRMHLAELHKNGVRVKMIGRRDGVAPDIIKVIEDAEVLTRQNDRLDLNMAFNYGSRDEIIRAVNSLAQSVHDGEIQPGEITKEMFSARLDTAGTPDPDLLIRTSGELRLSNYLLWQCAYTEFVFPQIYWPDFSRRDLEAAIDSYRRRDRRFGGRPARSLA